MKLIRTNFAGEYTSGALSSEYFDSPLHTLEQEWRPSRLHAGGANNDSCVPNGEYQLIPFKRPKNGIIVPMLINHDLGVYAFEDEVPATGGRFLILMHPGNTIKDIVGCIASGMYKVHNYSVNDSRDAQMHIMQAFNAGDTELIIESSNTGEIYAENGD